MHCKCEQDMQYIEWSMEKRKQQFTYELKHTKGFMPFHYKERISVRVIMKTTQKIARYYKNCI